MSYPRAPQELINENSGNTFGVGPKVADCSLLYSFHKREAFTLDIWILKYIRQVYGNRVQVPRSVSKKKHLMLGDFMRKILGKNAGYAQLFLYEKIRRGGFTQNRVRV
jgi:N-glycosylase/DNA lyase